MSKYIVSIGRNNQECVELINNGEIEITKNEIILDFLIEEDKFKKIININEIKNQQIKFIYKINEITKVINIEYNLENFFIKFDNYSKSAYQSFLVELNNINKIKGVLYYNSGNIKMTGDFLLDENTKRYSANGDAIVYYDDKKKIIFYKGEIEDENYDGSGTFYNKNNNISLKINNIDKNTPIGKGFLIIKNFNKEIFYEKEINFDEIEDVDLMNFDLSNFIDNNQQKLFNDLSDYNTFKKDFNIQQNLQDKYFKIKNVSINQQIEILYKKQLEFEIKFDEMIGKINFIFDKMNQEKKNGFLW